MNGLGLHCSGIHAGRDRQAIPRACGSAVSARRSTTSFDSRGGARQALERVDADPDEPFDEIVRPLPGAARREVIREGCVDPRVHVVLGGRGRIASNT